jgi:hypothetical protein
MQLKATRLSENKLIFLFYFNHAKLKESQMEITISKRNLSFYSKVKSKGGWSFVLICLRIIEALSSIFDAWVGY